MNGGTGGGGSFLGGSFKMGRIAGIDLKVHVIFIIWIAITLATAGDRMLDEVLFLSVVFGSVLLHEFGHCFGARWVGGSAKEVILWPLGGLARLHVPHSAWAEFVSTAAGPAVNLALFALAGGLLFTAVAPGLDISILSLFFLDTATRETAVIPPQTTILWAVARINLFLLVFNILPAYPMDGGRIFRSMLWPLLAWRKATLVATVTAMVFGVGFVGLAILMRVTGTGSGLFLGIIGALVVMASFAEYKKASGSPPGQKWDDSMPWEGRG